MSSDELRAEINSTHRKLAAAKLRSLKANLQLEPEDPPPRVRRPLVRPAVRDRAETRQRPSQPAPSTSTPKHYRRFYDPGQQVVLRPVTRSPSQPQVAEPQPHQARPYRRHDGHERRSEQHSEKQPFTRAFTALVALLVACLAVCLICLYVSSAGPSGSANGNGSSAAPPGEPDLRVAKPKPLYNNRVLCVLDQASA